MVDVGAAIRSATQQLASVSDSPRLDAEVLIAHALGMSREALLLGPVDRAAPDGFEALIARRLAHEPVGYITGQKAFWTIDLAVSPAVLIPRPDSETLIEAAIAHFGVRAPKRILDLGTGSGALLLAALAHWPSATGVGIDASAEALAVAKANAGRLGFGERADFRLGDWQGDRLADLILCNPPYIASDETLPLSVSRYEPASALFAGPEGLDDYVRIAAVLDFAKGGVACIEIGSTQATPVGDLFRAKDFIVGVAQDIEGRDRCLIVTR